jgi:hypothetical protein
MWELSMLVLDTVLGIGAVAGVLLIVKHLEHDRPEVSAPAGKAFPPGLRKVHLEN